MPVSTGARRFLVPIAIALAFCCTTGVRAQAPQIEIEIRNTATPDDDYLTWAPTKARIRQQASAKDLRVVLQNDPPGPIPPGREYPLDGDVVFDRAVAPGETASKDTLELTLPKTGAWVDFIVAGKFPRASTKDKDAIIEVHDATNGTLLHRHALMVRIRKDHRTLTDGERTNYLKALSKLHRELKLYERFVRIHEIASMGKYQEPPDYFWPDLSHRAPGFLAWHRAFLLAFERELQKIDPSVALPYWRMDLLTSVFEENFVGANPVTTDAFVEPTFAADNPLAHWVVNGEPLYRFPKERRNETDLKAQFFSDDKLFVETTYARFSRKLEGNPHNVGHNWTGPWMQNCMISPSDPVFWPFHTGFDRQWAKWQWSGGRIQPDGSKESYFPNDAYDDAATGCDVENPNACVPIGHHLKDTMWPWNSALGPGATIKGNRPPANLSQGYVGPFPKSAVDGLWPAQPAVPTPADVIDYAGATPQRLDMGFGYDDVPFGAKPPALGRPAIALSPLPAGPGAMLAQAAGADAETVAAAAVARDRNRPESERIEALRALGPLHGDTAVAAALGVLNDPGRGAALAEAAIGTLSLQMMFGEIDHRLHHRVMTALHNGLTDRDLSVRQAALRVLAAHRDPALIEKLAAALAQPTNALFPPADAIRALAVAGATRQHASSIRRHVLAGESNVRAAAIVALASDPESRPLIRQVAADRSQPEAVRSAAIRSLATGDATAVPLFLDVLKNANESQSLRAQAASAMAATVETSGNSLSKGQLDELATALRAIEPAAVPAASRALRATDALREKK
jgi:hypothetical protein